MKYLTKNRLVVLILLVTTMLLFVNLYTMNVRYKDAKQYVDSDLISLITRFSHLNESIVNDYEWYIDKDNSKPLYAYENELVIILQDLDRVYLAYGEEHNSSQFRTEWYALMTDLQHDEVADETYALFLELHLQIQSVMDEHGLSSSGLNKLKMTENRRHELFHDSWLEAFGDVNGLSIHY